MNAAYTDDEAGKYFQKSETVYVLNGFEPSTIEGLSVNKPDAQSVGVISVIMLI